MTKEQIFNHCQINVFDKNCLCIQHKEYMFAYQNPDSCVKEEEKGKYSNFGGLQCNYAQGSPEYEYLYRVLLDCAQNVLKTMYEGGKYISVNSGDNPFNKNC